MSASPYSVTIEPVGGVPVDVTDEVEDLQYSQEVPGGHAACSFRLPRGVALNVPEGRAWGDVIVMAGGRVVYQGRIEKPTRRLASGETLLLEAYGWQRHASDDVYRGIFKDTRLDQWQPHSADMDYLAYATVRTDDEFLTNEGFRILFPGTGVTTNVGNYFQLKYELPSTFPQAKLRQVRFYWQASAASADRQLRVIDGANNVHYSANWATSETLVSLIDGQGGVNFSDRKCRIQVQYIGTSFTASNDRHVTIRELSVTYAGPQSRTASDVVSEVIAGSTSGAHTDPGFCPKYDTGGVQTSGYQILDALVYPEPVEPRQVFDEMLGLAPTNATDMPWIWAVWERLPSGLYRFVFEPLPDDIAYVTGPSLTDIEVTEDHAEVFNKAAVQFFSPAGAPKEVTRTQTIQSLSDLGVTRTITLGPLSIGGTDLANRIGDVLLEENKRPTRSAQISDVRDGEILDAVSGEPLPIWRLRAGKRLRLASFRARHPDISLRDDESVFLIRSVHVDAANGTARLTLDNPTDTTGSLIARMGG